MILRLVGDVFYPEAQTDNAILVSELGPVSASLAVKVIEQWARKRNWAEMRLPNDPIPLGGSEEAWKLTLLMLEHKNTHPVVEKERQRILGAALDYAVKALAASNPVSFRAVSQIFGAAINEMNQEFKDTPEIPQKPAVISLEDFMQ